MRKAILSVSLFNVISAGLAFCINIFLARYFSVELYGRINLLLSFTLIINTISDLGFSNTNVIFNNKNKKSFSKEELLLATKYYFKKNIPIVLLIGVLLIIFFGLFFNLTSLEIGFLFIQGLLITFFRFLLSFHQAFGNWTTFNLLNLSLNVFKILFIGVSFCIPLFFKREIFLTYNIVLIFLILACILSFVFSFVYTSDYIFLKSPSKITTNLAQEFKKIWHPLIGINIIIVLAMRSDTLIIQKFLGDTDLGIYSVANSLALVFPLLTNSIMQVLLKETSDKGTSYLKRVLALQKKYALFIIMILIGVDFISYNLIPIIFGNQYQLSIIYFQILIIAHAGGLIFTPLESYFYSKETKFIFYFKGIQLSIIIVLSIAFIKILGLLSVALAVLLSRVLGWFILSIKSKKELKKI